VPDEMVSDIAGRLAARVAAAVRNPNPVHLTLALAQNVQSAVLSPSSSTPPV